MRILLLSILFTISINVSSNAQVLDTINQNFYSFDVSNDAYYKKTVQLLKGDTVLIKADTAYLVNSLRLSLYEQSKNAIILMDNSVRDSLIRSYKAQISLLKENLRDCNNTMTNIGDSVSVALDVVVDDLSENIAKLKSAEMRLDSTKSNLNRSIQYLDDAKKQLSREKWMWGLGGTAIGILTGLIVSSVF